VISTKPSYGQMKNVSVSKVQMGISKLGLAKMIHIKYAKR